MTRYFYSENSSLRGHSRLSTQNEEILILIYFSLSHTKLIVVFFGASQKS